MRYVIKFLCFLIIVGFVFNCGTGLDNPTVAGGGASGEGGGSISLGVSGYVQKGPFSSGSSITIQELDDNLTPTGTTYETVTNDDFGSFAISSEITSNFIEVISQGFYFNEISGELSDANLTLRTLSLVTDISTVNINILTTLSKGRIGYLIENEEKTYNEAREQAEEEILEIFGIAGADVSNFDQLDISEQGIGNAILLAISVTLQGSNTVAELSELLSQINLDITEDGTLDNATLVSEIRNNAKNLSLTEVRDNLEGRYTALGLEDVTIPNFEDYVDSDGDGTINVLDDGTYIWGRATAAADWSVRKDYAVVAFDDKLWVIGGRRFDREIDTEPVLLNDVWYSEDGVTWSQATDDASWPARDEHTSVVFDNKMWVMGGYTYSAGEGTPYVASNDVWYSEDGVTWTQATGAADWDDRIYFTSVVFDSKIWVIGGYYKTDVWYSSDGVSWTQATSSAPFASQMGAIEATVFDNKIWVIGGGEAAKADDVYYSSDGATWTQVTGSASFGGRRYHTCATFNDMLWVMGGGDLSGSVAYNGHVWYSSDGSDWTQETAVAPWAKRQDHASVVFDDKIWVMGGVEESTRDYKNDVWYYVQYSDY